MATAAAKGIAEINQFAYGETFPELHMDRDTITEVKATWMLFCAKKGGVDQAEDAVRKKLQGKSPEFAQLMYPSNGLRKSKNQVASVDVSSGRATNEQEMNQHLAKIMKATSGAGDGGGCPGMRGMGGMGGALQGQSGQGGAKQYDGEIDMQELKRVVARAREILAETQEVESATKTKQNVNKKDQSPMRVNAKVDMRTSSTSSTSSTRSRIVSL